MAKKLITPPTEEPITVEELKAHLQVTHDDDDDYINSLIGVSRQHVENLLERALMPQTWDIYFDEFPTTDEYLRLAMPPLRSVTSVKYIDANGAEQTLDPTTYDVDDVTEPGRIYLASGKSWPATRKKRNAVVVRVVCGYTDEDSVPGPAKHAISMLSSNFYENREPVALISGTQPYELPLGLQDILWPLKVEIV